MKRTPPTDTPVSSVASPRASAIRNTADARGLATDATGVSVGGVRFTLYSQD